MTDTNSKLPPEPAEEELTPEQLAALEKEDAMSSLLKKSLAPAPVPVPTPTSTPSEEDAQLLSNVQRKLRQRSKGKFYADGWSTSQSRLNYGLIAGVMLVVIVAVYLALGPMGISLH